MTGTPPPDRGWRGTPEAWLTAAHELLLESGIDAVKVAPLAQRLGLSRTSFYHHFASREALLDALRARWRGNTDALIARARAYAETLPEAMLNLIDCWFDPVLFDSALESAIRNWAQSSPDLAVELQHADDRRIAALTDLFVRFGWGATEAETRARVVYLTQIGYFAMRRQETFSERHARVSSYVEIFADRAPSQAELARFTARHQPAAPRTCLVRG